MNKDLMRQATGQTSVARQDRRLVAEAREVVGEIRLAGIRADGAAALGDHVMSRLAKLDRARQRYSQNDPGLNEMLGQIEMRVFIGLMALIDDMLPGRKPQPTVIDEFGNF